MESRRLLRLNDVRAFTGLGRSHLYGLIKRKQFPSPIKIGERASAWLESEVTAWVSERIAASGRPSTKDRI